MGLQDKALTPIAGLVLATVLLFGFSFSGITYESPKVPAVPAIPKDELEIVLEGASMANKTLIIAVVNKAYAEENSLLDLFLRSFRQGVGTEFLLRHLLLVAVDQTAFDRCSRLHFYCYKLVTDGVDFSGEKLYMSDDFVKMMWQRTHFLGDVLKRGYSFVFTDVDVMWLRNPLTQLGQEGDDLEMSCDKYNGNPYDDSNPLNTGFYYVRSSNRTARLFDMWYEARNNFTGMKEQDVLTELKSTAGFKELGLRVRFLDTLHFGGFCQKSREFREVRTMHANCCRSLKAKLVDLRNVFRIWRRFGVRSASSNSTSVTRWPIHKACMDSWFQV